MEHYFILSAHIHEPGCMYIYVCIYVVDMLHVCMCICMYWHPYVGMKVYIYADRYPWICMYVCYMLVCICMYIHIFT